MTVSLALYIFASTEDPTVTMWLNNNIIYCEKIVSTYFTHQALVDTAGDRILGLCFASAQYSVTSTKPQPYDKYVAVII